MGGGGRVWVNAAQCNVRCAGINIPLSKTHCNTQYKAQHRVHCQVYTCTVQSSQCTTQTEHTAQVWRRDAHRSGTCSVIKPTGPPSADDIWGINLTRPVSSQIYSAMLLGRLSCYHTDCGLLVIGFPIPWLDHFHREGGCIFSWMVTEGVKTQTSSQYWIHYKRERLFGINNTNQMLGVPKFGHQMLTYF